MVFVSIFTQNDTFIAPCFASDRHHSMGKSALAEELMNSNRTAIPIIVIINDEKTTFGDLIIEIIQTTPYTGVPIAIDTQQRDLTQRFARSRERLIEPTLHAFRQVGEAESFGIPPYLFKRCRTVIERLRGGRVISGDARCRCGDTVWSVCWLVPKQGCTHQLRLTGDRAVCRALTLTWRYRRRIGGTCRRCHNRAARRVISAPATKTATSTT